MDDRAEALLSVGRQLLEAEYQFVTPTPETLRRVNTRAENARARDLRDVFGFSRAFSRALLPAALFDALEASGELAHEREPDTFRARVRFSRLGPLLLVHSSYPTVEEDAVFFGPDTYRFARLLAAWAPAAQRAIDIGCGTGAGGLSLRNVGELVLGDVNARALRYTAINAALNEARPLVVASDVLQGVPGVFDLIVANPPYMRDRAGRTYRDGGGAHGEGLALRIVRESLARLARGGTLIVYTGAAIVAGVDSFASAVFPLLRGHDVAFEYEELDPDVFGEELDEPGYRDVERIAAVGLRVRAL